MNKGILLFLFMLFISCDNSSQEQVYRIEGKMRLDGRQRTYLLSLPSTYFETTSKLPLVIALHGTGGKAVQMENDYGLTTKANQENFIIVYPEGVQSNGILKLRTWNAGSCCHYAEQNDIDDVKFIRNLIDKLTNDFNVDDSRVYVTGMSNGAMMAYRLACEIPEKITAIAPVSGVMVTESVCSPSNSMPILHIHSVLDKIVPYEGGEGLGGYVFPSVDSILEQWQLLNQSNSRMRSEEDGYIHKKWIKSNGTVYMESYITKDGGHAWPGGLISRPGADEPSQAINATDLIWDFFQRF